MQINDIKGVVHVLLFQYLNPRFEWKVNPLAETADYVLHFLAKFYPPKTAQFEQKKGFHFIIPF